ncbi:MAG: hypothetical protein IJQ73_06030 [Kiritimatiellae bacterium]|nr:hypothetical protein [Kiritimatiellia bacterium]
MSEKSCLLDWTVLDLCEDSYRKPYGVSCETINTFDLLTVTRWKLIVVCLNAKICDNTSTFDIIMEDYAPLLIKPLPYDVKVQNILNLCKERELPIVAQVADDAEKCLVIATCHEPWTTWFLSIFGDYDEAECIAVNNELSPTITKMLVDLHRQKMGK